MHKEQVDDLTKAVLDAPDPIQYYNTSISKIIILSICTFGIYELYWMYKNWKIIKSHSGKKIHHFARTWFSIFFCFPLFKIIILSIKRKNPEIGCSAGILATMWIFFCLCGYVSSKYEHWSAQVLFGISFLSLVPIVILQKKINIYNASIDQQYKINQKFTGGSIALVTIGGLVLILYLFGIFMPSDTLR